MGTAHLRWPRRTAVPRVAPGRRPSGSRGHLACHGGLSPRRAARRGRRLHRRAQDADPHLAVQPAGRSHAPAGRSRYVLAVGDQPGRPLRGALGARLDRAGRSRARPGRAAAAAAGAGPAAAPDPAGRPSHHALQTAAQRSRARGLRRPLVILRGGTLGILTRRVGPMKILFVGAGAIGSYLGGFLTRAGHDVTLIDPWAEQVETVRQKGISVTGPHDPFEARPAIYHLHEAQRLPRDFEGAFVAMKGYDTAAAAQLAVRHLKSDGFVVAAENCWPDPIVASVVGKERAVGLVMSKIGVASSKAGHVERGHERGGANGHDA